MLAGFGSPVLSLLVPRGPDAVLRTVGSAVVHTFNRILGWTLSHISNKIFNLMPPTANSNSSSPVIFIIERIGVVTSIEYAAPDHIERMNILASRQTMRRTRTCISSAAARTNCARSNSLAANCMQISAVASTQPKYLLAGRSAVLSNCNQTTKTLTCDIYRIGHGSLLNKLLCQVARLALVAPPRCALYHGG